MKTKSVLASICSIALLFWAGASHAVLITFNDEATFLGAVGSATTYDFETSSGFPADTNGGTLGGFAPIGLFDGINFDASVYESSSTPVGEQSMTGPTGTFSDATLTFSPGTTGFGFFGLDLTQTGPEVIRVTVDFLSGPDRVFDIGLEIGDPNFTPKYFGVWDSTDSILSAMIMGTNGGPPNDITRAWNIDDLSVAAGVPPVPVPAAIWLFGTALIGLVGFSKRRKAA